MTKVFENEIPLLGSEGSKRTQTFY